MPPRLPSTLLASLAALALAAGVAHAQRGRPAPEFTRQGLLVTNFAVGKGTEARLGRRAADAVRGRVAKLSNKREVDVIDSDDIDEKLQRASFHPDSVLPPDVIRSLGRVLRADEYVSGTVERVTGGFRLAATLVLQRDERMRQPLPTVTAPKLDDAAEQMARTVVAARAQLPYERRCENALRDRKPELAVEVARAGVATFATSTIARTCLVWALTARGTEEAEVLSVARAALAVDSMSPHVLESAAIVLDTLRRRDEAAALWLRLAATDTANLELAVRVIEAMIAGGNTRAVEPFAVRVSDAHADHLPLLSQKWRVAYANRSWTHAVAAGEALLAQDSIANGDPVFFHHLATTYRALGRPFHAVAIAARGVSRFPDDGRLYALYSQLVLAEADTTVPRGLALFAKNAELLALQARQLRSRGKLAESLDALRQSVALDSTLPQGHLVVAQTEIELGRPDSALASLHRALGQGEDSTLVAQFAMSRGNALYRAANGTKTSTDFGLAFRYLALADSVRQTPSSRLLVGAAALGVAQSALTESAKGTDAPRSCRLAQLGASMIPVARAGLEAGRDAVQAAADQSLDYLKQLEPYAGQQVTAACGATAPPNGPAAATPGPSATPTDSAVQKRAKP